MIKIMLTIVAFSFLIPVQKLSAHDLNYVRSNFLNATENKEICQSLIDELKNKDLNNVELAYLGALETIWAKYVGNPFSKLSTFNKGKEKLEKAVKNTPYNLEIRYLRLSVQKNAPSFLGYNENIKSDEAFLRKNIGRVELVGIKKRIEQLLKA